MARSTPSAILLVDGYNVIGAWARLQQLRDRHGLEEARRELVEALLGYSSYQNYETEVVFDSHYQATAGSREKMSSYLSICYTQFRQTADSYIELTCSRFRTDYRRFHQRLIVATSDRAQQQTILGYGAEWLSALRLQAEVETVVHRVRHKQKAKGRSPGRFLSSSLNPEAQERLTRLRMGQHPSDPDV